MKKRMLSFLLCFVLAFSSLTALAEPVDSSVNADKSEVLKEAANGEDAVAGFVTGSGVLKDGSEYGYGYSPFLTEDSSEEEIVSGIKSSLEQSSEDKLLSSSNSQTANSHDAAVNLIKSYMVSRTTAFNIYLDYDISNIYTECNNLQDEAMDEKIATNTKEGDYLRQNTLKWGWNSTGNSVNFNYTYTASAAQETEVDAKVNELLSSLGLMDSTKSTVDKIKAIHDYLCDTITYYNDGSNRCHSTYGALISKSCVCQGYGSAFQRLCKEAGIGVRSITGTGNGESHAWNIVRLDDGYWYNLDATWDDQITTIIRDYYLKSNADFGAHVRANRYNTAEFNAQYPMTSISYVEEADIETLNIDNPEFKFTALDDSEISSTVDGRAKLLIFFSTTCWKSQQTIASLEECDWLDKVDVYCLEVNHQDAVTVETFANTYAPKAYENENIIFAYDETYWSNYNKITIAYTKYKKLAGLNENTLPFIVMIDTDNKFQVMTSGLLTADKIKAKYLNILDSSIPKPTQAPLPTATPTQAPTATPTQAPLPTEAPTVTPTVAPSGKVTEKFTDVSPDKWYAKEGGTQPIQYVIDNGIMKGTGDGTTFAPEEDCSREMMVQILYNTATDQSYSINNPFNDVQNKWYKNAVLWAYEKKITTGKGDGIFGIGNGVTRQEMAKFLLSYATYRGYETYVRADISSYADASSVAGWALDAMRWANAAGIINGKTENGQAVLAPTKGASRAEVAQMIMNFQKKFGK